MAAARLVELVYSRRNLGRHGETREGRWSRRTFPLIVLLHSCVIAGTLLRGQNRPRRPFLALLLLLQPLRAWVLVSLREGWNVRGAVPVGLRVTRGGPYAYVRHPNYVVVLGELAALPLAFRCDTLAVLATACNASLLGVRIAEEESLLFQLPDYAEHFADKPRFLPQVF